VVGGAWGWPERRGRVMADEIGFGLRGENARGREGEGKLGARVHLGGAARLCRCPGAAARILARGVGWRSATEGLDEQRWEMTRPFYT
jgi:hypothetical protein